MPLPEAAMKIAKINEDEQRVFGWASVSTDKEGRLLEDSHGHVIEPAELEAGAYEFVLTHGDANECHFESRQGGPVGLLIESVFIDKAKAEAMGMEAPHTGWWVGFEIEDPEKFAKVKSGEYGMLSIEGTGMAEDVVYDESDVVPYSKQLQSDVFSRLREAAMERFGGEDTHAYIDDFDIDEQWAVCCVSGPKGEQTLALRFDRADDGSVTLGNDVAEVERQTTYRPKASPHEMIPMMTGRNPA